jgi:hypothetical protein
LSLPKILSLAVRDCKSVASVVMFGLLDELRHG